MTSSLISVPVREPYKLVNGQLNGTLDTDYASIFKPDFDTFITSKDKLHKWAMWRTNVNHSFIRNLPVLSRTGPETDEVMVREKRIDIDRFLVYSDTDELRRLQMRDTYGNCSYFSSRLGESTYFLYGLPRIIIRQEASETRSVQSDPVVPIPPPPPPPKSEIFVGAGQLARSLDGQQLKPIELSHAQRVKYGQVPADWPTIAATSVAPSVAPSVKTDANPTEIHYEVWKKTYLVNENTDEVSVHDFKWDSNTILSDTDDSDKIAAQSYITHM